MVKVWVNKRGQVFVTVPKAIAESLGWTKGTPVFWEIMGKDKLKLEKVKS